MRPCKRRCWECGNVADHDDVIHPYVNCKKCGSQDTRLVKAASTPPPARDWKPEAGEWVMMEARINEVWKTSETCTLELRDRNGGLLIINVPLSSIRPMTGRDGGK